MIINNLVFGMNCIGHVKKQELKNGYFVGGILG
jgi:hypothetical protein